MSLQKVYEQAKYEKGKVDNSHMVWQITPPGAVLPNGDSLVCDECRQVRPDKVYFEKVKGERCVLCKNCYVVKHEYTR